MVGGVHQKHLRAFLQMKTGRTATVAVALAHCKNGSKAGVPLVTLGFYCFAQVRPTAKDSSHELAPSLAMAGSIRLRRVSPSCVRPPYEVPVLALPAVECKVARIKGAPCVPLVGGL
ncbi:unnamed protein product [Ostreobium quekettii]|uniref:Uncharacterized protein n=1 Tax=Ostreobium quekettii TaxID=121088 RepID=A0A8S1IU67_9CHLO|nr:unnamed protein product [Ostreobium quekettii]